MPTGSKTPGGPSSRWSGLARVLGSPWPRLVLLAAGLGVLAWLGFRYGTTAIGLVKGWVAGLGVFGPIVFVLLYVAAALAFFPVSLLNGIAGVLFGPVLGVPLVWLGCMGGAYAAFFVGRRMSRSAVEQLAGMRMQRVNAVLARRGVLAIAVLRLFPIGPFAMLNYLFALTRLRPSAFLLGTGIGILPGAVVYTVLGGTVDRPDSPAFLLTLLALVLLTAAGAVVSRRIRPARPGEPSPEPTEQATAEQATEEPDPGRDPGMDAGSTANWDGVAEIAEPADGE